MTQRLLLTAAIGGGLFLGANVVAERVAEGRIAEQAQKAFGTSAKPDVTIGGFPIIVKILQGSIPSASLEGRDLTVQELKIALFRIELEGITASISDLTGGKPIKVERGLGQAEVTSEAITQYLRSRSYQIDAVVVPGRVRVSGRIRGQSADAEGTPRLVGRLLVFEPDSVSVTGKPLSGAALAAAKEAMRFEIDLPILPGGARITSVDFRQDRAVFIAQLKDATLDLSKSS